MKKQFKYFTLAIVALLMVGASSCSKDDVIDNGDGSGKETKSVFLKISNGPSTRAEVPTQTAEPVAFNSGHLYFTSDDGTILRYHSIGDGEDFTVAELTAGKNITNLPSTVTQVYVVGNTNVTAATNISIVKAQTLEVQSQGTIGNVNLYGEQKTFVGASPTFTAAVTLAPTVARIELKDITAKPESRITSFKVAGIFIDNYYADATVYETLGTLVDNSELLAADFTDKSTNYPKKLNPSIYDWGTWASAASTKKANPTNADNVWGYNVFATRGEATPIVSVVPRIIIRLTDIETSGGISFPSPQFITIKGFKEVSAIKSGHVYTIGAGALMFDETNLTPNPNDKPISVEVTVTLAKWVPVEVTPVL